MQTAVPLCQGNMPDALAQRWNDFWPWLCDNAGLDSKTLDDLQPALLTLTTCSVFAADMLRRYPEILRDLLGSDVAGQPHTTNSLNARLDVEFESPPADEAGFMRLLRRVRHRENVRIAWRDLNGLADISETLLAASDLADTLISRALAWSHAGGVATMGQPLDSEGKPQQLVVLGMGKLGGRELNFSSDIDLIFVFPERGETDHRSPKDNSVFFTRVGQKLINLLGKITQDGFVYRVDMRLRPFGESGALVLNFDATEHYYEAHGREWERYALLKARPVAGDLVAGEELLQRLRGFIYRRYIDYSVLEHLREMKAMIARQAAQKGSENNVKLGPGGIREVEFCTQLFQLVSGGRDKRLQQRSLFKALAHIGVVGMLRPAEVEALLEGYVYLRRVENRIQMEADQQNHSLPDNELSRWRLRVSMGADSWIEFIAELNLHRERVRKQFSAIFAESGGDAADEASELAIWHAVADESVVVTLLQEQGCLEPDVVASQLTRFSQDINKLGLSAQGRQRLDKVMAVLLPELLNFPQPVVAATRILNLFRAIARRSVYFSMLYEHPQAMSQLVRLCASSEWITEQLIRFPVLLDELLDPLERAEPPSRDALKQALQEAFDQVDEADEEEMLNVFRHFKNRQVLKVAAADVLDLFPVMKVSDRLSWIAELILEQALRLAWKKLADKHGEPRYLLDGEWRKPGVGIIGYGKLGGLELGYGSDLDIVFLHNSRGEKQYTDGEKSIDNATFFARLVQRIVSMMTVFTPAGSVYEVDLRLRPSGNSGLLVSSIEGFEKYQNDSAWTWEHQSLVRARFVAGDADVGRAFGAIRASVMAQERDLPALQTEVREMREKMWHEQGTSRAGGFDLKKSPGGITDIEFMVQYMALAHAHRHRALCCWPDNVRLLQTLASESLLDPETAAALEEVYRCFRDELHHMKLRGESSVVDAARFVRQREWVQQCWQSLMH